MTDIVERLRGHPGPDDTVTVQFRTMVEQRHEAADEIERLRWLLREAVLYDSQIIHMESWWRKVRRALETVREGED